MAAIRPILSARVTYTCIKVHMIIHCVKVLLFVVQSSTGSTILTAEDKLDDQTPIRLKILINNEEVCNVHMHMCNILLCHSSKGTAVFDFSGTGPEVKGNCNAPRAVTLSALIYCLRCMVGHDVPLNQVRISHVHKLRT